MRQVHNEKCRKYKQQIENLKMDLEEANEEIEKLKEKLKIVRDLNR